MQIRKLPAQTKRFFCKQQGYSKQNALSVIYPILPYASGNIVGENEKQA